MFRISFIILLAATLISSCQEVNEPFIKKTDVFTAGEGDYAIYRIPGLVVSKKGTLIAFCEARKNGKSDWDAIDIIMRRSFDQGTNWEAPVNLTANSVKVEKSEVALNQELGSQGDQTHNNAVMIVDKDGKTIHFVYCIEYSRCFYAFSTDDGETFSDPTEITGTFDQFRSEYDWKVIATGPGHGIQLKTGRLVIPVWMSTGSGDHGHRPSCITSIYSDDKGKTWQRGDIIANDPDPLRNPSETVAVELEDGRVMFNIRSESDTHRRAVAYSPDGATNWTTPKFDEALFEPICMGHIVRLSSLDKSNKSRILFSNPDSKGMGDNQRQRKNVSVKMSYDEGETWAVSKVLDPGISGYSDMAVDADKNIYVLYERGGVGKNQYRTGFLTLAKFNLEWLTDGVDSFD